MTNRVTRWIAPSSGGYSGIVIKESADRRGDKTPETTEGATTQQPRRPASPPKHRGGASPVAKR